MNPQEEAKEKAGALLPDVDPAIAEIVLSTMWGNPSAHPSEIVVALVSNAPTPEVAVELVSAMWEMLLCWDKGHLVWIEVQGQAILAGARRVTNREAMVFGQFKWPIGCLYFNQPTSITIDSGQGRRRVWIASEDLKDIVMRQSEVVALGNALIESFGGRIIEDRSGPEVMRESYIEANMTKRAKHRAGALSAANRLTVEANRDKDLRPGHARTAMAEAFPGHTAIGLRVHPEDDIAKVYVVDRRLNESWVSIVAEVMGPDQNAEACSWVREDGLAPVDIEADVPPHVGFTDEPAIARQPSPGTAG